MKWFNRARERNINTGKLTNFGVSVVYERKYFNKLEKYARFLELKSYFHRYEHRDPDTMQTIKNRQNGGISYDEESGMTTVIIPDCHFGCGSAPCSCETMWSDYQKLKKEFKHPKYNQTVTLDDVLKEMDESLIYRKVNN